MNTLAELRRRFAAALSAIDPSAVEFADLVLPSQDPKFGDYQANCAMPLGKRLGKPPREIAADLVAALDVEDCCEPPVVAGPGFINLRLRDAWLVERLSEALPDDRRIGVRPASPTRKYVIDYSSPNVAKPMHVGHIRSTVIGDALSRVLRFLGHEVITDNHIGDWGSQFGMIIYGYKNFVDEAALERAPVQELSRLYKLVNQLIEHHAAKTEKIPELEERIAEQTAQLASLEASQSGDEKQQKKAAKRQRAATAKLADLKADLVSMQQKVAALEDDPKLGPLAAEHPHIGAGALQETADLHSGDAQNRALWERFLPACLDEMDGVYQMLGVDFDYTLGESHYHDALPGVVDSLSDRGLATVSDGAKCVFLDGFDAPFIVQKSDGAYLYATTDLATIEYRMQHWQPDAILYVVDHRQSQHFEQLFATARLWGCEEVEFEHVKFGTVLGEDEKPYKTRSGSAVGLTGLLDEAVQRALAVVTANDEARDDPLFTPDERLSIARRVGIAAVKYADLAHNRESDYVFSYDKMLAMNGNTAAYMQYSYARVSSIFERAGVDRGALRGSGVDIVVDTPQERALAVALVQFGETLSRVAEDYRPNHLTAYLFDLASKYSVFFEHCPVLKAPSDAARQSRLALCELTARTIACGLGLLGIEVVERM